MKMKKNQLIKESKNIFIFAILVLCIAISVLTYFIIAKKRQIQVYYHIPVGNTNLQWGMNTDEVVSVLGEPTSVKHDIYGDILTYNYTIPSDLGDCSKIILYVGNDNIITKDGKKVYIGLAKIDMQIDTTSEEQAVNRLTELYGNLTSQATQMQRDIQKADPDYFNKLYYSNEWQVGCQHAETYERFKSLYESKGDIVIPYTLTTDTPLVTIRVLGFAKGENYTCDLYIDATVLAFYEALS